jgi:hypothetical protein
MPKTFNDLTPEQQAAFWADVKRWGLEESDVHAESNRGHLGSNACISSLAAVTNVKTKPFTLTSVEQMKEMVGNGATGNNGNPGKNANTGSIIFQQKAG